MQLLLAQAPRCASALAAARLGAGEMAQHTVAGAVRCVRKGEAAGARSEAREREGAEPPFPPLRAL